MPSNTTARRLHDAIERLRRADRAVKYDWQPVVPEPEEPPYARGLKTIDLQDAPTTTVRPATVLEARAAIRDAMNSYMAEENPQRLLLIRVMPGIGKTFAAVQLAEELAQEGRRGIYAGPRHALYPEILKRALYPELWMEWHPRQFGDDRKPQTCGYETQINTWMRKGHEAMAFCSGVCGWEFVKNGCPYHRQKNTQAMIVYAQHAHAALGHPLMGKMSWLIGDESPVQAFSHQWDIPARFILPAGMEYDEPLTAILHILQGIGTNMTAGEKPVFGPELIDMLGGPDEVISACESFEIPVGKIEKMSEIHSAPEVETAPYFHLFQFVPLLLREARQAKEKRDYVHRIYLDERGLSLLLRRPVAKLPPHVIWLDATGQDRLYQEIFGLPVEVVDIQPQLQGKVYQLVGRNWGKLAATGNKRSQLASVVGHVIKRYKYKNASLISFKDFVSDFTGSSNLEKIGHFYAARGTNEHEAADAVLVAGTPQADIFAMVRLAKMIYFTRDAAFRVEWTVRDVVYEYRDGSGKGRQYPVSGFWNDLDLQVILESIREDEILQAAHRGRPAIRKVDTWLITSVPIHGMPPDEIFELGHFIEAPKDVNKFTWMRLTELMEAQDRIIISDIKALGVSYATAEKYFNILVNLPGWQEERAAVSTGRPPKVAQKTLDKQKET